MTHSEKSQRNPPSRPNGASMWHRDAGVLAASFRNFLSQQELLCDRLELVADSLPDNADSHGCLQLAQGIMPVVKRAHEFEEFTLYPFLVQAEQEKGELLTTLDRLRFEHLGDEEFGNDLALALRQFAISRETSNVESLAWMLRGFFEALRRHLAFEREYVLPLIERRVAQQ